MCLEPSQSGRRASAGPCGAACGKFQRGFLLVTAVVLIVVAALVLSVMVYLSAVGNQSAVHNANAKQALFIAGTGLERGVRTLLSPVLTERLSCGAITGDVNLTDFAFGAGRFTVTAGNGGVTYYPATTLKANVSATDSIIPVNNLSGYANAGRVLIDREAIDYYDVEPSNTAVCGGAANTPCLVGAQRGRDGTVAVSHVSGTPVGQYQCDLQAQGGVPDFANVRGKRILQEAVQLQEGWAVGANGTIVRWAAGPTGTPAWTAAASPVTVGLEGVSMLSYADGWMVGQAGSSVTQRPLILHWDGNAWATRNSSLNINQDLFGIHCVSSNDCWAVGTAGGGIAQRPLVLYWNGTVWGTRNSGLNLNVDLNDVHCVATDYCWAVGTAGGSAAQRPLTLYWNGSVWTAINNTSLNINVDLNSVFCVGRGDCWAVGTRGFGATQRPLILRLSGTTWSPLNSSLNIREDLNSIYCVTTDDCWAVGTAGGGVTTRPLILHWDGTAWSTNNSSLNINQDLMAAQVIGARQYPRAAWREIFP